MSDAPLNNSPEARTPTGELKEPNSTATQTQESTTTQTEPEVKAPEVKEPEKAPDGKTVLTKKEDAPAGAPEKYEAFKLPEGFTLSEDVTKEVSTLFKDLNLSQAQAQSLIDFHTKQTAALAKEPYAAYDTMRQSWRDEVTKTFGSKLPEMKTTISRAFDALGDAKTVSEFKAVMDLTGVGDNPAMIAMIHTLASRMVEGKHVAGSGPSALGQQNPNSPARTGAAALYPNLPTG